MQLRETAFNTHETTRLSLLINISNSCMWGDEKGKHICHPTIVWDVSSPGVNLLYRTTPENLEFPFRAHWPQARCLFCFQTQSATDPSLGLHTAPHSTGTQGILCRLSQKFWTNECYFVPFLVTVYLQSRNRGSVFMWMPQLLAGSSARSEYLNICTVTSLSAGDVLQKCSAFCFSIAKELRQSNNKKSPNLGELSH